MWRNAVFGSLTRYAKVGRYKEMEGRIRILLSLLYLLSFLNFFLSVPKLALLVAARHKETHFFTDRSRLIPSRLPL